MEKNNEKKELLKVRKKYSVKYALMYNLIGLHLVSLVLILALIFSGKYLQIFLYLLFYFVASICVLAFCKKSAAKTYVTFYEDKVVYIRKFLFINKKEEMKYNEIKEISFFDGEDWGKLCKKISGLTDMEIYPKKGNILLDGIIITNVYPANKVKDDVNRIIGDKIING